MDTMAVLGKHFHEKMRICSEEMCVFSVADENYMYMYRVKRNFLVCTEVIEKWVCGGGGGGGGVNSVFAFSNEKGCKP